MGQLQATCSQLSARDAALLQRVSGMVAMECASQMASLEEKVDEMVSDIAEVSSKRTAASSRPPSRKSAHSYSPKAFFFAVSHRLLRGGRGRCFI